MNMPIALMRLLAFLAMAFIGLAIGPHAAQAHRLNESYVYFNVTDDALTGRFEATLGDLNKLLPLDENGDGVLQNEEVEAHLDTVFQFLAGGLSIELGNTSYEVAPVGIAFLDTPLDRFAQIGFRVLDLTPVPAAIMVNYQSPFASEIPGHLGFALIESNSRTGLEANEAYVSAVFPPGSAPHTLSLVGEPNDKIFRDYFRFGLTHVLFGFEHLIFLAFLLSAAVMVNGQRSWQPAPSAGPAFLKLAIYVTAFAFANAMALALAGLDLLNLPEVTVEFAIALSILFLGLAIWLRHLQRLAILAVLAYGFFHGASLENTIFVLGTIFKTQIVGIGALSLGAEAAQLLLLLVLFPVFFIIRTWKFYNVIVLRLGSVLLAILVIVWVVEKQTGFVGRLNGSLF